MLGAEQSPIVAQNNSQYLLPIIPNFVLFKRKTQNKQTFTESQVYALKKLSKQTSTYHKMVLCSLSAKAPNKTSSPSMKNYF